MKYHISEFKMWMNVKEEKREELIKSVYLRNNQ